MGNCISCISHSSVSAPVAHTIPPRTSAPVELPWEIWREIAAVASADSVVTLRHISRDLRSAIDSLDQANLHQINRHSDSTVNLYQSDDRVRSVTKDPKTQGAMARDENISPALQEFFAHSNDAHVRRRLACNPSLSSEAAQQTLAQDQRDWIRRDLARNPSLSSEAAQKTLVQDQYEWVREALAGNPCLTSTVQQTLAQDQHEWVRRALVRNPSLTSEAAQQTLAQDQCEWVREALAGNPCLTSTVQQTLAQDPNRRVRAALARNPSLSSEAILERQTRNLNRCIRMFLRQTISADR